MISDGDTESPIREYLKAGVDGAAGLRENKTMSAKRVMRTGLDTGRFCLQNQAFCYNMCITNEMPVHKKRRSGEENVCGLD
ncbi:MAG TPA: hypothetical protein IAA57_03070 [Candidatus Pullilachnospira intestinigallinarum]|nr:hypothetical protein [Candidatus Pullilachnospira intestinigallinarum]